MKRAQIYLDEQEYEAVRVEAFKRRTSMSAIFRHLVQVNMVGSPQQKRDAGGLDPIIGMVRDPRPDVAEHHDDYLWGQGPSPVSHRSHERGGP